MAASTANVWSGSDTNGSQVRTYDVETARRDVYCAPAIKHLTPEATPFLHILNEIGTESVKSTEWYWYDTEANAHWTKINNGGGYTDSDTTMTVDDANIFKKHDLIKVPRTSEVMLVTEVNSSTSIDVSRGAGREVISGSPVGGTAAAALNDDDNLLRIGTALPEGGDPADSKSKQPTKVYNYIESFSDTVEGSWESDSEAKKTNTPERQRQRKERLFDHRLDIARNILFSERNEDTTNYRKLNGGLMQFISTNSYDISTQNGGYLTEDELEDFCEMLFTYGSKNKLFMTSPKIYGIINRIAREKIVTTSGEDTYGLRLRTYQSSFGDLKLAYSEIFEREYAKIGFGIDLENVKMKTYDGNWLKLRQDIQAKKTHGWMDEYFTQCGLEVRLEKTHAQMTGVSA
jgi:hypothetical protein